MATHYTCALRILFLFFAPFPAFLLSVQEQQVSVLQPLRFLGASFFFGESWIVIRLPSSIGI